jgi:hypothetical protein
LGAAVTTLVFNWEKDVKSMIAVQAVGKPKVKCQFFYNFVLW